MKSVIGPETAANLAKWFDLSDVQWVGLHVPRFERVRERYKEYQAFLEVVFKKACEKLAPLAVVEGRTKGVASFAEKILRKRRLYQDRDDPLPPDPLVRLTDLCGVRVVVQTAEAVQTVCKFIEAAFDIDWPNSEDVSQRLKPTEFGYRSVHYIVQVNQQKLEGVGIHTRVPAGLMGFAKEDLGAHAAGRPLKAEIQVRTLLEHAAASLGHDSIYKSGFTVPDQIKRHHATLSAMLENVDTGFAQFLTSLRAFHSSCGTYREREAVEQEIARLRIVLALEQAKLKPATPNARPAMTDEEREAIRMANGELAVRIARHALAIGEHETAKDVLKPYQDEPLFAVQRTLGQTLTEMHWNEPNSKEFLGGRALLEAACAHPPKDSETLCLLAESTALHDSHRALELFHEAIQADATEPVTLARYLEFEIEHLNNDHPMRLSTPMIRNAMDRCRKQVEARVNLPAAWASLAFFQLLVGKPFEALDAIAQVGVLCQPGRSPAADEKTPGRPCAAGRSLRRLRESLRRVRCIRKDLDGYDWCERAVLLILAVRVADQDAHKELLDLASWRRGDCPHFSPDNSIVILSGACVPELQDQIDVLRPHLLRACGGLSFKLLCGGTRAGISELAGDIAKESGGRILGYGYMPRSLPRGVAEETDKGRVAQCFSSSGTDFTPLDPLQGWTDLIAAGIDAARVKVLAYAGGTIAHTECAVALALGARVGVIENPALPKGRQFADPAWQEHPNLVRLPMDAMTFRAFLLVDEIPLSEEERQRLEKAARRAHEDYVASATPRDPSLKKWEDLDESLKLSNFHQVVYWKRLLKDHGLGLRPLTKEDMTHEPLKMEDVVGEEGIRLLAEMEHGRWNVERLLRGWRHAKTKDIANKLNPCLVPWPALLDIKGQNYQPYDVNAIRAMPTNFRAAGLELYRI